MNGFFWLPSILVALTLITLLIACASGLQTKTWPKKILRGCLILLCTYLLFPLVLNSATWVMHKPTVTITTPPPAPLPEQSGLRYCELVRDPYLSPEEFQNRLAPLLRAAPIATPIQHPHLLKEWGEEPTFPYETSQLHPPLGFLPSHTAKLLNNLPKKTQEEKTQAMLFLLRLGNQLTSLHAPEPYLSGREILRKTLILCAKNKPLSPEVLIEIQKVNLLPQKRKALEGRIQQKENEDLYKEVWPNPNLPSFKIFLLERKTHFLPPKEKPKAIPKLLLTGQLYTALQILPQKTEAPTKPLGEDIEARMSRLASLLLAP